MTVAPPFFLVALALAVLILALLGVSAGVIVRYLGSVFPSSRIQRPMRSVVLAVLISFILLAAISVVQALASLVPDHSNFYVPYSIVLYIASFGVFFFRTEAMSLGKKELIAVSLLALIPSGMFELGSVALDAMLSHSQLRAP
jgi:Na+/melibiose symporter-like transporter